MKRLRIAILICIAFLSQTVEAQKYAVFFTDKNGTPYDLSHPEEFLSQRALERRYKFNIALSNDDLPVNPAYIKQVENNGATVIFSSKWLNCTLIQCNADIIGNIQTLTCVDSVVYVYPDTKNVQTREKQPITPTTLFR